MFNKLLCRFGRHQYICEIESNGQDARITNKCKHCGVRHE